MQNITKCQNHFKAENMTKWNRLKFKLKFIIVYFEFGYQQLSLLENSWSKKG